MVNNLTKVFIKISSWLLGRPSGTPDMVFGVKDGAIVKGVFMSPILEEIPDADASKAGRKFIFAGTGEEWTYARAGQFGTLAEGEPWPVKGYKELIIFFVDMSASLNNFTLKKNDGFENVSFNELFSGFLQLTWDGYQNNNIVALTTTKVFDDSANIPFFGAFPGSSSMSISAGAAEFDGANTTFKQTNSAFVFNRLTIKLYPPTT